MSTIDDRIISVHVDPSNPGQFFACCGLFELAERLWSGAVGWFERRSFALQPFIPSEMISLGGLVREIGAASLKPIDPENETASPIQIGEPFNLRLDWWQDNRAGGNQLKVWAGTMRGLRIARAMQAVLANDEAAQTASLFNYGVVVRDPNQSGNKVEPYYFDGRRGAAALPLDIGFAPDALQMTNIAYPAVELLCLVGLQRFRPVPTDSRRIFDYYAWPFPLELLTAPVAAAGLLPDPNTRGFRFENAFRTDQRKHKAFSMATPLAR
jgi:CRISPR-associated protein Csb3